MKQKLSITNIALSASFLIVVSSLVLFDYHRVQKDFSKLQADLMLIRFQSITEGNPLVVKFNGNKVSVLAFPDGPLLETSQFSTISKIMYDTTVGKDMIVYNTGTTSMHNKRIHGGEIVLKSWLGFSKHILVNCSGLAREGRYPDKI
jgi:hypothetical protein